jgi:hypothetical protein
MRHLTFGVLATLALLLVYGGYSAWAAFSQSQPIFLVTAILGLIAAVGLGLRKNWSKYLVYLLALVLAATWIYATWRAVESGALANLSALKVVLSLLPGCLFLAVLVACSLAVRGFFTGGGSGSNNALEQTRDG